MNLSYREALRKRILFVIAVISGIFLVLNLYCESVVVQSNGKEVQNSGFGSGVLFFLLVFWSMLIGSFTISSLIADELENKSYVMILSKPIHRITYIVGKMLGVILLCTLNAIVLVFAYIGIQYLKTKTIQLDILYAGLNMFPSLLLLISLVGLITILLNRTTSLMITFFCILSSTFLDYPIYESNFKSMIEAGSSNLKILEILYWIVPQFGTAFYHSFSFIAKSLSQTHYLGNYSHIQITVWIIILWIIFYFSFRNKELG
jgi:ABC-type transport system involved in multi-copper enzyme maturation permease subunit